ncbi:MAG: type II CAAX endopeptidase family protein [Acidobacteriota bacterium]
MSDGTRRKDSLLVGAMGALAATLFIALFRLRRLGPLDFWSWMTLNIVLLVVLALLLDKGFAGRLRQDVRSGLGRKLAIGAVSSAALYVLFVIGRDLALRLFSFAEASIANIYALKSGSSSWRVALLLGLIIGPGEELFWRGFFQERAAATTCPSYGFALTAMLYTAVHLAYGNLMLVLAAAVCGVFWGWLYMRFRSPLLNVVSHTAWDLAVFLLFPFFRFL